MAEANRSIESILAALAQRPPATSTPNPPQAQPPYQQTPTPGAYPPAMPPGVPPAYGAGAYSLPQPSSSGNFDLSAIKPVNSGTVSIADAIAQAKAFATEKGISSYDISRAPPSYQAHDPRAGDGRHYRSRSRSPPGRDAYRDNFNPYRDERRDDSRGNYGRNRSVSPGANRGRSYGRDSPRGSTGRGGGGGGGDDDTETIQIESSLVGLIIGRQGENLRRVESSTGCRVQFITGPDNQGPYRQCRITGPRARRAEAKDAINRIIEDSGMGAVARADNPHGGGGSRNAPAPAPTTLREGEDVMQIMVPDRTVGLIIGRGGETIRDLQERSGCHVNITSESKSVNGLRPVNLIGTREAAAQAKELIMEIVDSDSRQANNGGGAAPSKPERHPKNDHSRNNALGGGDDKINDAIFVPSEAVGMIIGKGGETIREMQNTTGCKINVSQSSGPGETEREIGLVGSRDAINRAKRAIEDKVEAVRQKNSGGGGGGRGGRTQGRRDYDNPNYSQGGSSQPNPAAAGQPPAAANGADPYAAYGGYQNYIALWYQALAAQGQTGGEMPKPAGP
ncbi:KH domain-containing protein [Seiridium cupressi]